jgi:hypothetical protein
LQNQISRRACSNFESKFVLHNSLNQFAASSMVCLESQNNLISERESRCSMQSECKRNTILVSLANLFADAALVRLSMNRNGRRSSRTNFFLDDFDSVHFGSPKDLNLLRFCFFTVVLSFGLCFIFFFSFVLFCSLCCCVALVVLFCSLFQLVVLRWRWESIRLFTHYCVILKIHFDGDDVQQIVFSFQNMEHQKKKKIIWLQKKTFLKKRKQQKKQTCKSRDLSSSSYNT